MPHHHLRPADYRVMPWKNGLGTTTEIAVDPPGAALDAFTWRVSIADLGASGPFSIFAGYDRTLVQIEGAPMTLSHAGGGEHRLSLLAPYRFAGELEMYGALSAPPARDFNVMVRREEASADVVVSALEKGASASVAGDADTWIVHVLCGAAAVEVDGDRRAILASESLLASGTMPHGIIAADEGATLILVAIAPAGRFPALV